MIDRSGVKDVYLILWVAFLHILDTCKVTGNSRLQQFKTCSVNRPLATVRGEPNGDTCWEGYKACFFFFFFSPLCPPPPRVLSRYTHIPSSPLRALGKKTEQQRNNADFAYVPKGVGEGTGSLKSHDHLWFFGALGCKKGTWVIEENENTSRTGKMPSLEFRGGTG